MHCTGKTVPRHRDSTASPRCHCLELTKVSSTSAEEIHTLMCRHSTSGLHPSAGGT
jgi:hypothetical protein